MNFVNFYHHLVEVISLNDLDNVPEIDENGLTFSDNATIKAKTIAATYPLPVVQMIPG